MKIQAALISFIIGILLTNIANGLEKFTHQASYAICFTPGDNCTQKINHEINTAQESIYIQAYAFTSRPIVQSLLKASKRGIKVYAILDKSNRHDQYSKAYLLQRSHIPVWIDNRPKIAHNKVMIIDKHTVITGSFNFSIAAQKNNAENLIILHDKNIAKKYLSNWEQRQQQSIVYSDKATHNDSSWRKEILKMIKRLLIALLRSLN